MNYFHYKQAFKLESGHILPEITIAYSTYGTINKERNNIVWICHALTANSNAVDWWPGVIGSGCAINPETHFIVCANILGSCYGTTGPLSINPHTQQPYYNSFPSVTIRDMVKAHILLRQHLQIENIYLLVGGSMGGYQALEWCIMEAALIQKLFLIGTSAQESAWGIAIHTAQRLAIEADATWNEPRADAGQKGLKAARAIGMITYRTYDIYEARQTDEDNNKLDKFKASSYIEHQGNKLVNRFNVYSYWLLTKAMDSHNLIRNRSASLEKILQQIQQKTLIIGITSDILCPPQEQYYLAKYLPDATYIEINSIYGHDGFLVEAPVISEKLSRWMKES